MTSKYKKYSSYKDSGVEWLGEIPEEWELMRFKYIARTQKGKLPKHIVSENLNNEPPYMSMEYLRGGEENQWVLDKDVIVVDENETLLLWDGSNAGEFIKSRKGVISSTVAHISFKNINNRYAWYFSKKLEIELRRRTIGMGIPHVNGGFLNNSLVTIPFPQEQTSIANFLDDKTSKIDTAIAQKEQMIALLKERKQIVIQNAVTGKWSMVNGKWGETPKEKMKDSGVEWIGEIPEGWEVKRLASFGNFSKGGGFSKSDLTQTGVKAVIYGDIYTKYEFGISEPIRYISKDKSKDSVKINKNDLLFTGSGETKEDIGKCVYLNTNDETYAGGDIIIFRQKLYDSAFLSYSLNSEGVKNEKAKTSKGEIIVHTYASKLKDIYLPIPPVLEQIEVRKEIDLVSIRMDQAISLKQTQIEKLKEYKSTLIDSAVTGKIRVSD